jgi:hypothetical protein
LSPPIRWWSATLGTGNTWRVACCTGKPTCCDVYCVVCTFLYKRTTDAFDKKTLTGGVSPFTTCGSEVFITNLLF